MPAENPLNNNPKLDKTSWPKKNRILTQEELNRNIKWPNKNLIPDVPEKKKKGNNSNIFKDDSLK